MMRGEMRTRAVFERSKRGVTCSTRVRLSALTTPGCELITSYLMEGDGKRWKGMEADGRGWKGMEGVRRRWKESSHRAVPERPELDLVARRQVKSANVARLHRRSALPRELLAVADHRARFDGEEGCHVGGGDFLGEEVDLMEGGGR